MKWSKLPRAAWDIIEVLLQGRAPVADRITTARALCQLKWKLNSDPGPETHMGLAGRELNVFNDKDTQFVLKEIWVERVYEPVMDLQPVRLLDLGANVGLGSLFLIRRFPSLREIVAYEPDPACFARLRTNVPEAKAHREAVGQEEATMRVSAKSGIMNARVSEEGEGEKTHVVPMRSLLQQQWDIVKMDIEGAEWGIFEDLLKDKTLLRAGGYWMIEFHEPAPGTVGIVQIKEAFASIGFKNMQKGSVMHFYHEGPMQLK